MISKAAKDKRQEQRSPVDSPKRAAAAYDQNNNNSSSSSNAIDSQPPSGAPGPNGAKILNTWPNIAPRTLEYNQLVEQVRIRFNESLVTAAGPGDGLAAVHELYDQADLEELAKPLPDAQNQEQSLAFRLISRFVVPDRHKLLRQSTSEKAKLAAQEKMVNEAVECLRDLLKFRKQYQLSTVSADQFPREFYNMSAVFVFGHDPHDLPIIHMRPCTHRRWSAPLDQLMKRYLVWQIDRVTKSNHGTKEVRKSIDRDGIVKDGSFGICFDVRGTGYSNLDLDFLGFITRLLVNYYPTYCRYSISVDLPWIFKSVWRLVITWLPEEVRNTVIAVSRNELTDYIDLDQLPNSLRLNLEQKPPSEMPDSGRTAKPLGYESMRSFDEIAKDLELSSKDSEQFKAYLERLRQDNERVGLI